MIKVLLGEVKTGRLMRLPYLGYSLLLYVLMSGFGFAVVLAIDAGEQIIGGDVQQAQEKLREMFTLPAIIVIALVMSLFLFMAANIMAKRMRDIGLPGWWSVLAVIVVTGLVSSLVSNETGSSLSTLIWLVLLLIPGNALVKSAQTEIR